MSRRTSELASPTAFRRPSALDSPTSLSRRQSTVDSRRPSIDPSRLVRMDKVSHIGGTDDFNVVFVGAGNIMFGSDEGPWNHSFRFEHKLGPRLKVVALIDPAIDRATAVLQKKCDTFVRSAYEHTRVFKSLEEFVRNMSKKDMPRAVIVGSPPMFRGTIQSGRDIEIQIMKYFPGVAMFIEKPAATGPASELPEAFTVAKAIRESSTLCSVGYMLRYLRAVQMMKQIIHENNLTVMATIARYACAYEAIAKPDWWDKSKSAGPIVEQGTHFCDLSRYFGGEVDMSTVSAHSLEWDENAGQLSKMTVDETAIPPENRIPRVTAATWKYDSGAVGSFTHLVALQGHDYSCELEVYADGYQLKLVNPYVQPVLYIRRPGSDMEETHRFPDDDPFFSEISVLIDNIEDIEEDPDTAQILSSFEDACKTYELTWTIRLAAERNRKTKKDAETATPAPEA
ncbi:putative oxidoreductase C terminal-domain-containing protein [Daedaleopsis nitida]|nr:putative oxidoreductase C terminal-domain-containing protein [Daedaleopsis nitida]